MTLIAALTKMANQITELAINTFLSDWFFFILLGLVLQMEWKSRYIIPNYKFKQTDQDSPPQIWVQPEFHMNQLSHDLGYMAVTIAPIGYGTMHLLLGVYEYELLSLGGALWIFTVIATFVYCAVKILKGRTLRHMRLQRDKELLSQKQERTKNK